MSITERMKLKMLNRKWRHANRQNETFMGNAFDIDRVSVGKHTYGELNILMYNDHRRVRIGNYCSIAPGVCFVAEAEHDMSLFSTFPFSSHLLGGGGEALAKGDTVIGDDVWIGYGATIMSGVHIGQGAVIGAKSLVNSDIPPYAIAAGVPARIIRYRFSEAVADQLRQFSFADLDIEDISRHEKELYTVINEDNVGQVISRLSKNHKENNSR